MTSLKLLAPAKLNLCLRILDRRKDGYHPLAMLMEKISLCDGLVLEKLSKGIELIDSSDIPKEKNLGFRAAKMLHEVSFGFAQDRSASSWGVRIQLTKKIPMGAGLGGGSSDAAAVLKGLNQLWKLNWPVAKLAEVGVKLGADVSFFLYDGPAIVEGIGERVKPIPKLPKLWIILIYPGVAVDTAWAYRAWDEAWQNKPVLSEVEVLTQENQSVSVLARQSFRGGTRAFKGLLEILHSDFEKVVFPKFPEIQEAKRALLNAGAQGALMSGSGSAVFGLFGTKDKRDRAFEKLVVSPNWQVFTAEN